MGRKSGASGNLPPRFERCVTRAECERNESRWSVEERQSRDDLGREVLGSKRIVCTLSFVAGYRGGNFAMRDVMIIGAGPACLSAAFWCDDLGLDTLLLEQADAVGGQLHRVYNPINNY